MTQEEKRIKLAEAQGWRQEASGFERHGCRIVSPFGVWWHKDKSGCVSSPPDYFNDLNACHELHHSLNLVHQIQFLASLFEIVKSRCAENLDEDSIWMICVNASSEERCNAFGRALGLWKEGE